MPQNTNPNAGSRSSSEPAFLVVGKLRRPHGVRGEIPLELYSELLELLDPEQTVYIGERHQPLTIEASRWKQDLLLLKFRSLDDRTAVEPLTNALVYVESDQLPSLEAGEYYYHQLIGLKIYDEAGDYLGILTEVLQTGANDVYLVTNEAGEETLIPDTEEAVLEIDVDHSRMTVAKLKWYGEGD
jgi:16S rRNA processing protein RimM